MVQSAADKVDLIQHLRIHFWEPKIEIKFYQQIIVSGKTSAI